MNITTGTAHALESGEADLALGFLPGLDAGFYQQTLFLQDFVCLASAKHPRIDNVLTLRRFKEEAHVALTLSGTGHDIVDGAIEKSRIPRRVLLGLPAFSRWARSCRPLTSSRRCPVGSAKSWRAAPI